MIFLFVLWAEMANPSLGTRQLAKSQPVPINATQLKVVTQMNQAKFVYVIGMNFAVAPMGRVSTFVLLTKKKMPGFLKFLALMVCNVIQKQGQEVLLTVST